MSDESRGIKKMRTKLLIAITWIKYYLTVGIVWLVTTLILLLASIVRKDDEQE